MGGRFRQGVKGGCSTSPMENIEHGLGAVKSPTRFSRGRFATTCRSRPPPLPLQRTGLGEREERLARIGPLDAQLPNLAAETVLLRRPLRPVSQRLCRRAFRATTSTMRSTSQAWEVGGAPAAFPGGLVFFNATPIQCYERWPRIVRSAARRAVRGGGSLILRAEGRQILPHHAARATRRPRRSARRPRLARCSSARRGTRR